VAHGLKNMPTSQIHQIPHIVSLVQQIRPGSVLDLGLGFGKYGFLLREYLDVSAAIGLLPQSVTGGAPKVVIDGVEAFPSYVRELQRNIYDNIVEATALDACRRLPAASYDCCLLIDVLEHLTAEDGLELLGQIRRIARAAVISTPKRFDAQGELCGNSMEKHLSLWTRRQLATAGFDVYYPAKSSHIAVHAESPSLKSTLRRFIWRSRVKELTPITVYDAYQRLRYGGGDAESC
jgi:SAM-dependent methyltransferase